MKQTNFLICTFFVVMCGLFYGTAQAATFTVTNTNDAGAGSLRQAITDANNAASNDVIMFDAGVFSVVQIIALMSGELLITGNGNLTITGSGANLLTVSGSNQSRVLRIAGGNAVTLTDLVIAGGRSTFAAGIFIEDANAIVTLERTRVENNSAIGANGTGSGASGSSASVGGIRVNGTLNLNDSIVRNNMAQGGSGAIGFGSGTTTGNSGGNGGGADSGGISVNGTLNVSNSIVRANTARGGSGGVGENRQGNNTLGGRGGNAGLAFGGGIYVNSSAVVSIKNSLLSENTASGGSGGTGGSASGTISTRGGAGGNSGAGGGGGIYVNNSAAVTITNSLLVGNSAQAPLGANGGSANPGIGGAGGNGANGEGGGISNNGTLSVTNSTIAGNTSVGSSAGFGGPASCGEGRGGGIYQTGTSSLTNVTLTGNSVTGVFAQCVGIQLRGGGIFGSSIFGNTIAADNFILNQINALIPSDLFGTFNSLGYNLIKDTTGSNIVGTTTGNQTGVDPLLGALQNNGGATFTRAPSANSPVINAGSNALAVDAAGNPLRFDQRGACFRRVASAAVDIGAFEVQSAANVSCHTAFDFDGDGKADISVYRPSEGIWYLLQSTNGFSTTRWGNSTDRIMPADYDGDGKTDLAVFRRGENSTWYILNSATNTIRIAQWGASNLEQQLLLFDTPAPSDYDGDGKADLAVWRLTDNLSEPARFLILQSSNNSARVEQWGNHQDRPVPSDYDGDGRTDLAIYRGGTWWILQSTNNSVRVTQFGLSQDKTVPADYDGDGKTDLAVYRSGVWYILQSLQGSTAFQFGLADDIPVSADYDGDGRADAAVYRNGVWYILQTTNGTSLIQFGLSNDIPIASAFVR